MCLIVFASRGAFSGIFSLGRKFEISILNQPLAALADFRCVSSLISRRSSVRHKHTVYCRPWAVSGCAQLLAVKRPPRQLEWTLVATVPSRITSTHRCHGVLRHQHDLPSSGRDRLTGVAEGRAVL